jgi:hypothetical protein
MYLSKVPFFVFFFFGTWMYTVMYKTSYLDSLLHVSNYRPSNIFSPTTITIASLIVITYDLSGTRTTKGKLTDKNNTLIIKQKREQQSK